MQMMRADHRATILTAVVILHLLAILILLAARPKLLPVDPDPPSLMLFEPVIPDLRAEAIAAPASEAQAPAGPLADDTAPSGPPLDSSSAASARAPRPPALPAPAMIPPIVALPSPLTLPFAPSTTPGSAAGVTDGTGGGDADGSAAGGDGAGGGGDGIGGGGARSTSYARAAWVRKPSKFELARGWPRDKAGKEIEGLANIGCYLRRNGRPKRCWIIDETHPGVGRASVLSSRTFVLRHVLRDDAPLDIPVRVPLAFYVAKKAETKE